MSKHSLKKSKNIIDQIVSIGKSLNYVVKKEFPIERKRRNPPAVDVAWLAEERHSFPLMIFEIESNVTNTIANNPVKVFGQPNENFEKPLFFFHIVAKESIKSSRLNNLKRLFGTYNYRTYTTDIEDTNRLIKDIISQHRRLYPSIEIKVLFDSFDSTKWSGVDIDDILIHIENLHFRANYLKDYASLILTDQKNKRHYLRYLEKYIFSHSDYEYPQNYGTYWGDMWGEIIHLGILIHCLPQRRNFLFNRLKMWQEDSAYISMIGPHLGLSRDYDEFIICMAPPFLAFIVTLIKSHNESSSYIEDQLFKIFDRLKQYSPRTSFFHAIWLLHITVANNSIGHFEILRFFINTNGGVSETFLYNPPDTIPLGKNIDSEKDKDWINNLQNNPILVPDINSFSTNLNKKIEVQEKQMDDVFNYAIKVILDPGVHSTWARMIVALLSN